MVPTANPDLTALYRDIDRRHAAVRADTRISEFLTASPASSDSGSSTSPENDDHDETDSEEDGDNGAVLGQDPAAQFE
jgi:hypothetical protein